MGACFSAQDNHQSKISAKSLIIAKNEIVELSSHKIHRFEDLILHENARLTVKNEKEEEASNLIMYISQDCILHKNAMIEMNGKGYIGAKTKCDRGRTLHNDPSINNDKLNKNISFFGGGGGGHNFDGENDPCCGGGGGYGTNGQNGINLDDQNSAGSGGTFYGDEHLNVIHYGSGGGAGCCDLSFTGKGGNGGGIIAMRIGGLLKLNSSSSIKCNGTVGHSFVDGCGSGGSIKIYCHRFDIHNKAQITAVGGNKSILENNYINNSVQSLSKKGGNGGYGRIAIYIKDKENRKKNVLKYMKFVDEEYDEYNNNLNDHNIIPQPYLGENRGFDDKKSFLIFENGEFMIPTLLKWICKNHKLPDDVTKLIIKYYQDEYNKIVSTCT